MTTNDDRPTVDRPTVAPVEGKWARLRNGEVVGPMCLWDRSAESEHPFESPGRKGMWASNGQVYLGCSAPMGEDIIEILDAPDAPAAKPAAKDDGGPAFPHVASDGHPDYRRGMSLRDWFAGQAASGLLAHPNCTEVGPGYEETTEAVADEAYAIADAMLRARKEGK